MQPAISTGAPNAEFFLNSLDPNGTGDTRVGVWAMTNRTALQHGGLPKLSRTVITSEAYGNPPPSTQKGSSSTIDSGDDRMQQTQYINGLVWGELTTTVTVAHDSTARAGAAWFSVRPSLSGGHIGASVIEHQGYVVETSGNNVIYPALQSLPSGNVAMVFTVTGAAHFPSAAYAVLGAGQSAFGAINIAAAGTGPYAKTSTRWGDYSWAVIDPTAHGRLARHRVRSTALEPDSQRAQQLGHASPRGCGRLALSRWVVDEPGTALRDARLIGPHPSPPPSDRKTALRRATAAAGAGRAAAAPVVEVAEPRESGALVPFRC